MKRRLSFMVACVSLIALAVSGCGVPADSSPREIPAEKVPFELLAPSTTQVPSQSTVETTTAQIYFVGPERLVVVNRTVASPLSLGGVIASLTQGVTAEETASGLRSAINPQTTVLNAQITNDGTAVLNVSDAFSGISLKEQILALGQLVYTATALPGVKDVQVSLNSSPVEVPRGDGSLTRAPIKTSDYPSLAPASTTTTTRG